MLAPSPRRVGKPPTAPHEGVPMGSRQESQAADGARARRERRGGAHPCCSAAKSALRREEPRAGRRRGRATRRGGPCRTGWTRSPCSRSRPRAGSPNSRRSATVACSRRRSPSTGAPPCSWRPTSRRRRISGSRCSSAATPTSRTSALFASPERQMLFDINDFDETLPGPWEWDVKRLAASFEVAGRELGFSAADRRDVVLAGVRRVPARACGAPRRWGCSRPGTRTSPSTT